MTKKLVTENTEILFKHMREMAKKCGGHRHYLLELEVDDIIFTDYRGGLYSAAPKIGKNSKNSMLFPVPSKAKEKNNYKSVW